MAKSVSYFFTPGNGAVRYRSSEMRHDVWFRLREAVDGRWETAEVYIPPDDRPVSADELRRIPLAGIEAYANIEEFAKDLGRRFDPWLSLEEMARESPERDADLRFRRAHGVAPPGASRIRLARVRVPKKRPYPATFYERVAKVYAALAASGPRPAAKIADASGVPVTTVHSWIKDCRRRGLLPAGRAGRAG